MVTVPTLAIAAHGAASGSAPGVTGIALCLVIGVLAALCTGGRCGALAVLTVLSGAQFVSHLALSATMPAMAATSGHAAMSHAGMSHAGMDHTGMSHAGGDHGAMSMPAAHHANPLRMIADHIAEMAHLGSGDSTAMVLTHLIAIPVCAALIAAAVAVFAVITSVLASIRRTPSIIPTPTVAHVAHRDVPRWHRIDRAAGAGERGPPLLIG